MIGIICKVDGRVHPIVSEDEDTVMATWTTMDEARDFADKHILCRAADEVLFINLTENNIVL